MIKTTAVLPINELVSAKSRLAAQMTDADRQELIFWMASHVLHAVQASGVVDQLVIVSPDPNVLRWASKQRIQSLYQAGNGLNNGLELGRRWAREADAEALLVLLADLPCVAADEVQQLVTLGHKIGKHAIALAPDRVEQGTNGLFMHLTTPLPFAFGVGSLARHQALAREQELETRLFRAPGLSFDVDMPADLAMLYEYGIWMPEDQDEQLVSAGGRNGDTWL